VKAQAHYLCHVVVKNSHLAGVVFCDDEYPSRAAMSVAMQVINDFEATGATAWKQAEADTTEGQSLCEEALVKYKVRLRIGLQQIFTIVNAHSAQFSASKL
jgi:hypothetical protein